MGNCLLYHHVRAKQRAATSCGVLGAACVQKLCNRRHQKNAMSNGHDNVRRASSFLPCFVQVVGGYLGYVGYFCLAAGIALACDVEVCVRTPHSNALCERKVHGMRVSCIRENFHTHSGI